ncbi:hypothetical protein [Anaeromyxobacter sp. PSR-1]|uniref:hypothetical protein n=1 Tax=Anaeromyxobacter sp. PSR-1 TaxID=1300915 RepID=UPI0005DDA39B|nr:hypothetical protein [Anaeromyxobacter sp. PSR-1]GAO04524.1 hypothetical protein PSR1_03418 [Anaeromyxobacter sp. PSR-1]
MKNVARKLALAAALTAAVPAAAHAKPCDHDAPVVAYPAPAPVPAPLPAPAGWRDDRWDDRGPRRHEGWRARERAALRAEYARLDAARDQFYARWNGYPPPGKARKFERWYAHERGELDRRWDALEGYAWR